MGIESAMERISGIQGRMAELGARLREPMLGAQGPFAARLEALAHGGPLAPEAHSAAAALPRRQPLAAGATPALGPLAANRPGWEASRSADDRLPGPSPEVVSGSATTAEQTLGIARLADEAARRHGLDPALMRAVMTAESGGDISARSPVGAIGLMQLMPATARELGVDPEDPAQNLDGGARYLADMVKRFGQRGGVAAYNAGPGAVARHGGGVPPYPETQSYVTRVLALQQGFHGIGLGREGAR